MLVMKKKLLILINLISFFGFSQTTYQWLNSSPDNNWTTGIAGARWNPGSLNTAPPANNILEFDNNHQVTMTNNVAGIYNIHGIRFTINSNTARTISGNTVRFFDVTGTDPFIRNFSTANHTFQINLEGDGTAADPLQIETSSTGGYIFNGTVNNQGSPLHIVGTNNATNIFNGVISGAGVLALRSSSIVELHAANTYTGNTEIDQGDLRIGAAGNITAGTLLIGNATR